MKMSEHSWRDAPLALQPAMLRSQVLAATQDFFRGQGFWEVTTPVFNTSIPAEMHLFPFSTTWAPQSGKQSLWMTTSPERSLKVMLARGLAPVFAIGKSMRNMEGVSHKHNPEFLMLEWYRKDADFRLIMVDVQHYVLQVMKDILGEIPEEIPFGEVKISLQTPWKEVSLETEFRSRLQCDLQILCEGDELRKFAAQKGYHTQDCTWNELFDQIVLNELEPHWPTSPFFLLDFPTRMSPLCTPQIDKPWLAERFEFYIGGMELANGNTEYTNVNAVKKEFERVQEYRRECGINVPEIDKDFLTALERMNDASYAGIGFGIDRLAMLLANVSDIRLVEPFAVQTSLFPPINNP